MTNRWLLAVAASTLLAAPTACKKDEGPASGTGAMRKVETRGDGLPTAPAPRAGAPEGANPHAGAAMGGGMPQDDVHRGAGAMGGMGQNPHAGMGDPSAMGPGAMTGHGPMGGAVESDGNPVPLRKTGLGSADEMNRALARVQGDEAKKQFEEAFRLTFSMDKSKRDIQKAKGEFEEVLKGQPNLAEAYRGLAYVALSDNFNVAKSEDLYQQALKVRPDYGEVHYALAFLYAGGDREKGAVHLKKALELKVPDEQGLAKLYGLAPAAAPAAAPPAPPPTAPAGK